MRILAFISAVMLLCVGAVFADYHYASHEGSDEYPYTSWETAADSIQKAIDASSPGDTVYVGSGEFLEHIIMIDSIGLIGISMDSTIIQGTQDPGPNTVVVRPGYDVIIQGLHIRGRWFGGNQYYKGVENLCAGMRLYNCEISQCDYALFGFGTCIIEENVFDSNFTNIYLKLQGYPYVKNNSLLVSADWNTIIEEGTIVNNYIEGKQDATIYTDYSSNCQIANNLFLFVSSPYEVRSVEIFWVWRSLIENNSMIGGKTGINLQYAPHSDTLIARNNIISGMSGHAIDIWAEDTATVQASISYNDFWNIAGDDIKIFHGSAQIDSVGNIRSDPMFSDTTDYWLQAFSPCIDAGDPEIFDVDGSRSDIGYTGGPGGISYQYVDLPPAIPDSFIVSVVDDTIGIVWPYATEADFSRYNIYRSNESGFAPSVENLYAVIDTSVFKDTEWYNDRNYYYLITAVDNQDNESAPSVEIPVIFVGIGEVPSPSVPKAVTLYQNYPNPFNPRTTIKYYLPEVGAQPSQVKIVIYDLMGKEVRALVDKKEYSGEHAVTWDGLDNNGKELSSGVYFYRLFWWGREFTKAKRMVLIR